MSNSILNWTGRVAIEGRIAEYRHPQNGNELTIPGDYHPPFGKADRQAKATRWLCRVTSSDRPSRARGSFNRTERKVQKMPLLFYLPFIIWTGLREVAQGETRTAARYGWAGLSKPIWR